MPRRNGMSLIRRYKPWNEYVLLKKEFREFLDIFTWLLVSELFPVECVKKLLSSNYCGWHQVPEKRQNLHQFPLLFCRGRLRNVAGFTTHAITSIGSRSFGRCKATRPNGTNNVLHNFSSKCLYIFENSSNDRSAIKIYWSNLTAIALPGINIFS